MWVCSENTSKKSEHQSDIGVSEGVLCWAIVTILFLDSALFLISSFHAMSPFLESLSYAYHHYLLILEPLTFTMCGL